MKLLDEYKFVYKQAGYIKDIATDSAEDFQSYYEEYCRRKNVDVADLEQKNKEKLDKIYGRNETQQSTDEQMPKDPAGPGDIVLFDGEEQELTEEEQKTVEESKDDRELTEIFSKLFKKIATIIHPDKLENSDEFSKREKKKLSEMFKKASTALEDRNYFILLDIAEELEIDPPKNYEQQARWIKKELLREKENLAAKKMSYNYMFSEMETDEQRDLLMRKFLNQLFGIVVPLEGE